MHLAPLEEPSRDEVVSSEAEELILVDANDRAIGHRSKARCHDGNGLLHRAFSLFVFNRRGELLLQQRAPGKRLWPGYWSNSCCSHPRRGEDMREAVERRLHQELALHCALKFLYKFEYHAHYEDAGSEHELCWVFAGRSDGKVAANRSEIEAWRFVAPEALEAELAKHPERFTPWFKLEWPRVRALFLPQPPAPGDAQVLHGAFS